MKDRRSSMKTERGVWRRRCQQAAFSQGQEKAVPLLTVTQLERAVVRAYLDRVSLVKRALNRKSLLPPSPPPPLQRVVLRKELKVAARERKTREKRSARAPCQREEDYWLARR